MDREDRFSQGKLIDFHSHILPNMDDGSSSEEMSTQMLDASLQQGVCCIVLTPHFYSSMDYPGHFLSKRQQMLNALREKRTGRIPLIVPGAEIMYFDGITEMQELPELRIQHSTGLMIEMPFCSWTNRMVESVIELNRRREFQVILAHIERYLPQQTEQTIHRLAEEGILIQANADFFTGMFTAKKAMSMLDRGLIHLLGSDCHNMTSRPPNLGEAFAVIRKKRGEEAVNAIINRGVKLLLTDPNDVPAARTKAMEMNR